MKGEPHLLVVGNGGAAAHAVMAARQAGHSGPIHLASDAGGPVFNPMLSPYYLAGRIPFEHCHPFGMQFHARHDVTCHFGSPVEELDAVSRQVRLGNGKILSYDRCLVATGASPLLPDVPGWSESPHVHTLRTARHTLRLHLALDCAREALILGASLIGLKMAEILNLRGTRVTLADVADRILPGAGHPVCAARIADIVRKKGVKLLLGVELVGVERGGGKSVFHLRRHRPIEADLCLACLGVKPNVDFIDPRQVRLDQGILVDHRMETGAKGLYAAGDVAQGANLLSSKKEVMGLWGSACRQGFTAGCNMAGREAAYPGGIPQQVSTFFGLTFVRLGHIQAGQDELRTLALQDPARGTYRLFAFEEGRLTGVNLINDLRIAGRLRTAILRRHDWTEHLPRLSACVEAGEMDRILALIGV